jgi:3-oxoacyl-[acyl-carrier protein] reductase
LVQINVIGVMHGSQLALEFLPEGGLVINVGSIVGIITLPFVPAYCASKAAVIAYTRFRIYNLNNNKKND